MRSTARETVFKIIFSSRFTGEIDAETKTSLYKSAELTKDDMNYCERVLTAVMNHSDELTALIDERSIAFPEKRIFPADRSILLVAFAEILYLDDVPAKVSVNEAANIASKYSSEKSAGFISGILSTVVGGR